MSSISEFKEIEGGAIYGQNLKHTQEAELRKTIRRYGVRPRKGPSLLERVQIDPDTIEKEMQKYMLNKKIAKKYNEKKLKDLLRELERSTNPKVLEKNWYTIDGVDGHPVRVTKKHVVDPFNMQPVIVNHPETGGFAQLLRRTLRSTVKNTPSTRARILWRSSRRRDFGLPWRRRSMQSFWTWPRTNVVASKLKISIAWPLTETR